MTDITKSTIHSEERPYSAPLNLFMASNIKLRQQILCSVLGTNQLHAIPASAGTNSEAEIPTRAPATAAIHPIHKVSGNAPSQSDVLCGQTRAYVNHTGNQRFQLVVNTCADKYGALRSKQEKMSLTKDIVNYIKTDGGRFLKFKKGSWTEISDLAARDKVSHALRTKVASRKRQERRKSDAYFVQDRGSKDTNPTPEVRGSKATNPTPKVSHTVAIPSKFDVLCGQSKAFTSHAGNQRFQLIVDACADNYDAISSKQEKMLVTREIVNYMKTLGGRFLKHENGAWTEISDVTARDKVSHALRTKVASRNKQRKSTENDKSQCSTSSIKG